MRGDALSALFFGDKPIVAGMCYIDYTSSWFPLLKSFVCFELCPFILFE
jgi:hypothetical protein